MTTSLNVHNLRLQKRLAASVLNCGRNKIWMDPNEVSEVATAKTRQAVRKLAASGVIMRKPNKMHSRSRTRAFNAARAKGRHMGPGNRKGGANARTDSKRVWITRIRVMRRLLRKYRAQRKIDKHLYHELYMKTKGFQFKTKKQLMEYIWKAKAENARAVKDKRLAEARRTHFRALREKKAERHALRLKARTGVYLAAADPNFGKSATQKSQEKSAQKQAEKSSEKKGKGPVVAVKKEKKETPAATAAPAKKEATPAKKDGKAAPAKKEATPAKKDGKATPAKKEATPAKKEAAPAKKEATPAKKEATPAKKEAAPAKKEATPAKKEAAPAKKEGAPAAKKAKK